MAATAPVQSPPDQGTTEPQAMTPEWWRDRLYARLKRDQPEIRRCREYYAGDHPLAFATSKFREAFGNLFHGFADNWCDLVVDASVERLTVEGFRFSDRGADTAAWDIWQSNGLDAESDLLHEEAVKVGRAYALIGPGDGGPLITIEDAAQCIVEHDPSNPLKLLAGLKCWLNQEGYVEATLYLPAEIHKYRSTQKPTAGGNLAFGERPDAQTPTGNPLGVVPLIPFYNRPHRDAYGQLTGVSDITRVMGLQNAANKFLSDMLVASEFAAFRQRWATGIEVPSAEDISAEDVVDPEKLDPEVAEFRAAVSRVWMSEDKDAKFGDFDASDLGNYVKAIETVVQHIAAQTRTPPHYLLGQSGAFPSGESLKSTETGLVAKVRRKHKRFGESWETVIRLAFKLAGDQTRSKNTSAETIWRDPESRTEAERVDALTKLRAMGLPLEVVWEKWGASPQEIARWKSMLEEEAQRAGVVGFTGAPSDQGIVEPRLDKLLPATPVNVPTQ